MDRIDAMRNARNSPHVTFTEYTKLRARTNNTILVFEGKQCPMVYLNWMHRCGKSSSFLGQLIARGKKNLLSLRDIIKNNLQTKLDQNLYFVDRDFDTEPKKGQFSDVYVTRGYAIENEMFYWEVLESFIRTYFDIADSEDHEALEIGKEAFLELTNQYIRQTCDLHRVIHECRTKKIKCYPGENIQDFVNIDWQARKIERSYASHDDLLTLLKIPTDDQPAILTAIGSQGEFDKLDPIMDWRGKFHFSFVRSFLVHMYNSRTNGTAPFRRSAKVNTDPCAPNLIGLLSASSNHPQCLKIFFDTVFSTPK